MARNRYLSCREVDVKDNKIELINKIKRDKIRLIVELAGSPRIIVTTGSIEKIVQITVVRLY